ncbi:hypothetical protein [Rhodoferax sp. PAMC 29310]|uniref:hypothetical protein n=1 Tax=Rhodoferax sp. PAMC 29310 TaxID=2822760 RepID=UPI001B32EEB6|nr:hypothetical protein [Rhodoferax sp. PAMC 29310]
MRQQNATGERSQWGEAGPLTRPARWRIVPGFGRFLQDELTLSAHPACAGRYEF